MSDISIPGVTSRIESGKIIDALMKVEKIPLTRLEDQAEAYKVQKTAWQDINRKITSLQNSAKALFGFQSPFGEKVATSSDESALTATAGREALTDEKDIRVIRTAKADRFLTDSLDKKYEVPAGTYEFTVGEETLRISFKGGKLQDFAKQITEKSKGFLKASIFGDTEDSSVLLLESTKTGSGNKLGFREAALSFALSTGMLERTSASNYDFPMERAALSPWTKPLNETDVRVTDNNISLMPGAEARLPLPSALPLSRNSVLEVELSITDLPDTFTPAKPPPGPDIPDAGGINFQDIEIFNNPSQVRLPAWKPTVPPKPVVDMNILFAGGGSATASAPGEAVPLAPAKNVTGKQVLRIPLKDYVEAIDSLYLKNNNTMKIIEVTKARIFDPEARGDYRPLRSLDQAVDAEFTVDGVTITRATNDISDVMPGVALHLKKEGGGSVNLSIEPNRELVKDSLISFVGYYNQLFTELNILSRVDSSVVEAIQYFTPEERKAATERLGSMQGDITLNQLKNSLQRIMMEPYDTGEGNTLRLLAQIGISTNSALPGTATAVDASKLKGYLEINETILDQNLSDQLPVVRNLFGRDTDGDLVTDTGVAYAIDAFAKPYTQSGGILASRLRNIDSQIDRTNKDIASLTDKLDTKEQDLKNKYGQLEGTLQNLDQSSKAIDNFSSSLNGGR